MNALIEVLLALLDVIKTDAQQSREPIYKFFISLSLLAVAGLALAGGIGLMLAALLLGLMQVMPVYFAALITGALSLALAGVLIWVGKSRSKE
ncbi:MAG TPA: phage holin family protein [bacterium]|nr:phage holin family protein [bacterium]